MRGAIAHAIANYQATVTASPDGTIRITTSRPGENPRTFVPAPQQEQQPVCTACQHFETEHDLIYMNHCGRGRFTTDPVSGDLPDGWLSNEAAYQLHLAETGQDGAEACEHALAVARAVLGQDGGQQ
ncbi:hypothetical protein ACFU7Y_36355 [Kitasatospora sp. NPDC057542]|uniref:hypothetical protein n=1 Tax=Kitasatospora sp. NPDC057542 TaxID=3346162 RepID=UPI0036974849